MGTGWQRLLSKKNILEINFRLDLQNIKINIFNNIEHCRPSCKSRQSRTLGKSSNISPKEKYFQDFIQKKEYFFGD